MVVTPHHFGSSWLRVSIRLAIAAIALGSVVMLQRLRLEKPSLWASDPKQAEQQEAIQLELLKQAPTFGFDNLIADWTFLQFLQYYGDTPVREQTGYSLSSRYFDIITRRDPRFVDIYLFLSGSVSHQEGKPELAIEMMDRGTRALSPVIDPKAFQVWRFKGIDQLLLLGDIPGSVYSHEMAAKWTENTPYKELSPLFQQTAEFLRRDPDSVPVRFDAWSSVYYQAVAVKDKQTQERAKQKIVQLGGEIRQKDGRTYFALPTRPKADAKSK